MRKLLWINYHAKLGKWQVSVRLRGKARYIGTFSSLADAAVALNTFLKVEYGGKGNAWALRKKRAPAGQGKVDLDALERTLRLDASSFSTPPVNRTQVWVEEDDPVFPPEAPLTAERPLEGPSLLDLLSATLREGASEEEGGESAAAPAESLP